MNKQTSLLRQLDNPAINREERARLRFQLAKELEEAGNFEAARNVVSEFWKRVGERPTLNGLTRGTTAEVLLHAGILSGWIGSAQQIEGAQETAKNLISESAAMFEDLQNVEKAAEAYIELAICYWREGALDEARATLREVLNQLAGKDNELKARALLNSAIVEFSANRNSDALRILTDASPLFEASDSHALKGKFHVNLALVLKNLSLLERRPDYADRAIIENAAASYHLEQAGHTRHLAYVENNLGNLLLTFSRFDEAHEHLNRARRLFSNLKESGSVAQVNDTRARALLAQGRLLEAEKVARSAVRILQRGDEQYVLAEALTTHGTALARLGRFEQSRAMLERAIEIAHRVGAQEKAAEAALTLIEELSEHLTSKEIKATYKLAAHLLSQSQHSQTLHRLRRAADRVISSEPTHKKSPENDEIDAPGFVYASEQALALLRAARRVATTQNPVLITGETGTGKELLAHLIHRWSGCKGEFVPINCAALTETLIESQLFGHKKGSFTDAITDHPGAVRQAQGGTLFLDEIGELSAGNQSKLLRLIEYGEVHAIGAPEPENVDVRIIAATNCNLKEEVAQRLFREDLYYRLQTFHLEIPPLRERPHDIPVLATHFIETALERHGQRVTFTPEAIEAMRQLQLKGNARELRSLIERTVLTAPQGAVITRDAVETLVLRQTQNNNLAEAWAGCVLWEEVQLYERSLIQMALEATQGHITQAARLLGITHQRLSSILQGRHKDLLTIRTPVRRRKRSIIKSHS